jgi:hypothetical protein
MLEKKTDCFYILLLTQIRAVGIVDYPATRVCSLILLAELLNLNQSLDTGGVKLSSGSEHYTQQRTLTEECRTNFGRHTRRTESHCTTTVTSHPYCFLHTTPSAVNSVHGFLSYPAKKGSHPTACVRNDEQVELMLHVPSISGAR